MTENSNEEDFSLTLDVILKKLTYSDLISVFFLLIDNYIKSGVYLCITQKTESEMKMWLRKFFLHLHPSSKKMLIIEILMTIKRYDLLKTLNVCRHKYQDQCNFLSIEWKSLFELCESFDIETDIEHFQKFFPGRSIFEEEYLEVFLAKAYDAQLITKSGLSNLLTELNKDSKKLRTWNLHGEKYFVKQPTKSSPCGLAVIINHVNFVCEENDGPKLSTRNDSKLDVDALEKIWNLFGFETQICIDYTQQRILQLFEQLSKKDLSSYDVFVTCYMSHGNNGVVYSSDSKPIQISDLIDFMANKCKSLVSKPKIFIIQACQGTQIQCGISRPVVNQFMPQIENSSSQAQATNSCFPVFLNTPLHSDVCIAVSNIPGFVSFAPKNKNSWLVEGLVEILEQFGHKKSFWEVMILVNNHVKNKEGRLNVEGQEILHCKQTVQTISTLSKNLFLKKLQVKN